MPNPIAVEEIVPLVDALSLKERTRLVRLITRSLHGDASIDEAQPPARTVFSTDEEMLAWDTEGGRTSLEAGCDPLAYVLSARQTPPRSDSHPR
ncbi:MAG: hypothetical protein R2729_24895 [Bryobacteraceae bacterium]